MTAPASTFRRSALRASALFGALLTTGAVLAASAGAAPAITSRNGVTVNRVSDVTARTFQVEVTTANVKASTTIRGNGIRVTLPADYATSGKRYPVLYLLHGGGDGSYTDWHTKGDIERISANQGVITVMPDGGKVGWYTNWRDQSKGAQNWETYHLTQLVPFIDGNLRTLARKNGRAVAGLSMGGYGAIHYAQARPDLFGYAASFSGALDLGDPTVRATVTQQSTQHGLPPFGAFGVPVFGLDGTWNALNPIRNATKLATVSTALYAGAGTDVIEAAVAPTTTRMHNSLDAARIAHVWSPYGKPGTVGNYTCNGGHNFGCWSFALNDALPRITAKLDKPA